MHNEQVIDDVSDMDEWASVLPHRTSEQVCSIAETMKTLGVTPQMFVGWLSKLFAELGIDEEISPLPEDALARALIHSEIDHRLEWARTVNATPRGEALVEANVTKSLVDIAETLHVKKQAVHQAVRRHQKNREL